MTNEEKLKGLSTEELAEKLNESLLAIAAQ